MAQDQTEATQQPKPMQLAEILSDLVSLRVCDPTAALALVSARSDASPTTTTTTATTADTQQEQQDPDLQRAKDLLKLHFDVKEAEKRGELSRVLSEARAEVERAVGG